MAIQVRCQFTAWALIATLRQEIGPYTPSSKARHPRQYAAIGHDTMVDNGRKHTISHSDERPLRASITPIAFVSPIFQMTFHSDFPIPS
jgi:hypothetical protein